MIIDVFKNSRSGKMNETLSCLPRIYGKNALAKKTFFLTVGDILESKFLQYWLLNRSSYFFFNFEKCLINDVFENTRKKLSPKVEKWMEKKFVTKSSIPKWSATSETYRKNVSRKKKFFVRAASPSPPCLPFRPYN